MGMEKRHCSDAGGVLYRGLCLLAAWFLLSTPAVAAVYRWVDENGVAHFTDRPPPGVQSRTVEMPAFPAARYVSDGERKARQQKLLDMYEEERAGKREEREKRQAEKRERETRCNYAQDRLRRYEAAPVLYIPLQGGERRVLSDAERDKAIEETREAVKSWCR
jgi:hypothetical protein